ncbi:hypothetical protein [Pantoea cypripedii]|uniref:hypothetical protein n=1 Tax=Pantoea cypripedii TaxID=55209 RepID=UPI00111C557D|nr:hypothetical protein [Pantoea cypripedii]MBP2198630.1 hypothetical protein [Pantoea cypripedii]
MLSSSAINAMVNKPPVTQPICRKEITRHIQTINNISTPRNLIDRPMSSLGVSSAQANTLRPARLELSTRPKKAIYHPQSSRCADVPARQVVQQFRDNERLIEQLPTVTEQLSESKSYHIRRFSSQCDDIFNKKEGLRKKIRQKAKNAWERNKTIINKKLEKTDNEKLKILFNTVSAVCADRQTHHLDVFWHDVLSLSTTCQQRKNYRRLWEFIVNNPHLETFLTQFDLWTGIEDEIREMLSNNNNKFFMVINDTQKDLLDKLQLLCAPIETQYYHQLCEIDYNGKTTSEVIESLINNTGLQEVLSETTSGRELWRELNSLPTVFKLDVLKNEIDDLLTEYKENSAELKRLKQGTLVKRISESFNILYRIPRVLGDLKKRIENKVEFGEVHILYQDLFFNALDRLQNAGVDATLKSLLTRDTDFQDMVVDDIDLEEIAKQVSPNLLYDPTECYEFICMASMLDASQVIAENIGDTRQLYHLLRSYYPAPREVDAFFAAHQENMGSGYDRGIMLAISHLLPPALNWKMRERLLLAVTGTSAYDIPPLNEFLLNIEESIISALNPARLEQRYQQGLHLDPYLVDKLKISGEQQAHIKEIVMDFLLSRNRYADADSKLPQFKVDIATILKLLPEKLSFDLATHSLRPSHFFKYHAITSNTLLTETLVKEIDHLYILHKFLDKMLDETFAAHSQITRLNEIVANTNINYDIAIYSNIALALVENNPFSPESELEIHRAIKDLFSSDEMVALISDETTPLAQELAEIRQSLSIYPTIAASNFFAKAAGMGIWVDSDGQKNSIKLLGDSITADITNEERSCQILSYILRRSFAAADVLELAADTGTGQPHHFLNTLTNGLITQINSLIATELDTALAAFDPGAKEGDRYTNTACKLIEGASPRLVLKDLCKTGNDKDDKAIGQTFTEDQFAHIRKELLTLLAKGGEDHRKDISQIFGDLRKTIASDENNHINYLLKCLNLFRELQSQESSLSSGEIYQKIIDRVYERGIPSRIAKTGQKLTEADLLEYFILENERGIHTESAKKFIQSINQKHRLSDSLLYSITLLEPFLADALTWRQDEIDAENKKIIAEQELELALLAYATATQAECDMAEYRADREARDAENDYEKAIDSDNKYEHYEKLTEEWKWLFYLGTQFSNYWIEMHRSVFVYINTNVTETRTTNISYATGEETETQNIQSSNPGMTMIRFKLCDILDKNGHIDYKKINETIQDKYNSTFQIQHIQFTPFLDIQPLTIPNEGSGDARVATITERYDVEVISAMDIQKGSYMHNLPSRPPEFPFCNAPPGPVSLRNYSEVIREPARTKEVSAKVSSAIQAMKKIHHPRGGFNPDAQARSLATPQGALIRQRANNAWCTRVEDSLRLLTQHRPENLYHARPAVQPLQSAILSAASASTGKKIIVIDDKDRGHLYKPGKGAERSGQPLVPQPGNMANQGNIAQIIPSAMLKDASAGKTLVLQQDGAGRFNSVRIQPLDASTYKSSVMPMETDIRTAIDHPAVRQLPPAILSEADNVLNAITTSYYMTAEDQSEPSAQHSNFPIRTKILLDLNLTDNEG